MIRPRCPHCLVSLVRRSNKGVFHYTCPTCLGFAVHFGGLVKILDPRAVKTLWETAKEAAVGKTECSHCRKLMNVLYTADSSVEVDICRACNLVWLDTGEWEDLKKSPETARISKNENLEYGRILLKLEDDKQKSKEGGASRITIGDAAGWKLAVSMLGIPVEREDDQFLTAPWVTWLTVGLCVLISLYGFRNMEWTLENLAFRGDRSFGEGLMTMISSFFVHGSYFHLIGNMYFLWVFGDNVEDHLGKTKFAMLLLSATILGDLLFRWLHPGVVPLVGASGGISGVISYYIMRFPKRQFVYYFFFRWFSLPAFVLGGLFFFKDALGAMAEISNGGGGVAHLAHLGGAAVGAGVALFYSPERKLRQV